MAFQPTGLRFAAAFAVVGLCVGSAGVASDRVLVVAAIADDVEAIIVRDESKRSAAYTVGDTVRGTSWRVMRVHGGEATLRSTHGFKGSPLEVRVGVGQQLPASVQEPAAQATGNE